MNLITSFLEYLMLEKKYSIHTITAYKRDLISLQDFCRKTYQQEKISEIHYSQIRSWIVDLVEAKVSNRSINRKISCLKSFYKYLQKIKIIQNNPLSSHKALKTPKKIQVPFSINEVNQVLSNVAVNDTFESSRNKLIVSAFLFNWDEKSRADSAKNKFIEFFRKTSKGDRKEE